VRSSIIHGEVREVANILSTVLPILGEREYTPLTIEEALCPLGPMDPVEEARVHALLDGLEAQLSQLDTRLSSRLIALNTKLDALEAELSRSVQKFERRDRRMRKPAAR
jgi:hypothetical protein